MLYFALFNGLNDELQDRRQTIMKKLFKENAAILAFSTGLFSASLVVGLVFLYGLDKIF